MKIARERYNPYVPLIEDAQTDIREIVKRAFLYREPKQKTENKLAKAIRTATDGIAIPRLKRDVTVSLINFANRQRVAWQNVGLTPEAVLFLASQKDLVKPRLSRVEAIREELFSAGGLDGDGHIRTYNDSEARGVPLNRYYGDVWRERVQPAIKEAARSNALDPNDYSGRNSLRNLSEMEVRYHDHLDNIDELKASGVRLVVCSSHADCSDRCAPWQGRIYSLDGTSGVVDGHRYVPLETATDVWYTTKAGRRYKNGLLGFNCYDDKTEVYTNQGWKPFAELAGNELFYTLNIDSRMPEWQEASEHFAEKYDGEMVSFKSATTDALVTPNHSMLAYSQKNRKLRFIEAKDCTTSTFFTAGQEWHDKDTETVTLGGKEVNADLYMRFMAYYLADGSKHANAAVKIAQTNNKEMYNELKALPFNVWRDDYKIVIHGRNLTEELSEYGKCDTKYVPTAVKEASRRQIRLFLDAFIHTDGYTANESFINGYKRKPHLQVFTTSKRMADDLTELALKAGYRPKVTVQDNRGKSIQFKNGTYSTQKLLYVIHLNRRVNITKMSKTRVKYNGYIYCVTVPNHTLLIRRNGCVMWCGNCRHYLKPYAGQLLPTVSAKERKAEYAVTLNQRRLERAVRDAKVDALTNKGLDEKAYKAAKMRAKEANEKYLEYCKANGRAAYPTRVTII